MTSRYVKDTLNHTSEPCITIYHTDLCDVTPNAKTQCDCQGLVVALIHGIRTLCVA